MLNPGAEMEVIAFITENDPVPPLRISYAGTRVPGT
jgi:hypothetical protein